MATRTEGNDAERWLVVPRALRAWALAHPHEWGLIFGTPVPGYRAPEQTVAPYARIATALVVPVIEAREAGRLHPGEQRTVSEALAAAVVPVRQGLFPDMPVGTVVRAVEGWTTVVGADQPRSFRALAQHCAQSGGALRGDCARRGRLPRPPLRRRAVAEVHAGSQPSIGGATAEGWWWSAVTGGSQSDRLVGHHISDQEASS